MCRIYKIRLFLLIIYLIKIRFQIYLKIILLRFKIGIIKSIIILKYLRIKMIQNKKYSMKVDKENYKKLIIKWMM